MEIKQLNQLTTHILTTYYQNDLKLYFRYLDEDTLWIGPRQGQIIRGKENMKRAWAREEHALRFRMSDLQFATERIGREAFNQLVFFKVATIYPNGTVQIHDQRILLFWKERQIEGRSVFRIKMTLISNAAKLSEGEFIYATQEAGAPRDAVQRFLPQGSEQTIAIRTERSAIVYLPASSVRYVTTADKGNHTMFVALNSTLKCITPIGAVEKQTEGALIRCHSGYLVNPLHVTSIKRFKLTMDDGAEIPVPEKKYTALKRKLDAWKKTAEESAAEFIAANDETDL